MRSLAPVVVVLGLLACEAEPEPSNDDAGSLCACREIEGVSECCFGHGECREQADGPSRCECDPGAGGETCSTPAPGVQPVRVRACEGDDPGCAVTHAFVLVESFDACVDLEGQQFDSVIVRPAADAEGAWPSGDAVPLAVLTPGASQHHVDYYDLLEHVAANGIVIAAFDASAGGDVTFRANRTLSYLECVRAQWPDADRLSPRTALIGHSRGGAAVAVAADAIALGLAAPDVEIVAVVALAPAQTGQFPLSQEATPAYFTLQGSRDPDTGAASLGWFDLAGMGEPGFVRALTWVHGATHHRFHQGLLFAGSGELQASVDAEGHWTIARAYVGGFLVWRLLEHDSYRRWFTGQDIPASVAAHFDGAPDVFAGLTDGVDGRVHVHDFDGDTLSPATNGGDVSVSGFVDVQLGPLAQLDAPWSGGHLEHGLRLDHAAGQPASIVFELPPGTDVSAQASLSLRLGRTFDGGLDDCGAPPDRSELSLILHDGAGSAELALAELGAAGRVEAPDRMVPETFGNWISDGCNAHDVLRPLRIPLSRFCAGGIDLTAITAIELRVDGSHDGGLLLDDLAFERGESEAAGCG